MKKKKSELIKLAAEMAKCEKMPSTEYGEWYWPKGMQKTSWRKVFIAARKAENQCKEWAVKLREIADLLEAK